MRKLAMTKMYDIKNLYENEGLSCRAIMAKTGHSYRAVKKYADRTDWNVDEQSDQNEKPPRYPVLSPMIPIIDAILEADRKVPRKQRHTAKRIHVLLREEHDFKGSYSAVEKYASKKKKALGTGICQMPAAQLELDRIISIRHNQASHWIKKRTLSC